MGFFFDYLKSLLQDENGSFSSKRLVGLLGALVLYVCAFVANHLTPGLIEAINILALGCLGLTSVDKFTSYLKDKKI